MAIKKVSEFAIPSFLRSALSENRAIQMTLKDIVRTNAESSSSFIYEPIDYPLKSTQQVNVDWSKFENHTFFMSAQAKTNIAFDQIINGYPFDGTQKEVESFYDRLSGFDKWVYDQFPKFKGQLMFSGTTLSETSPSYGTYISVKDYAGSLFPELSKNKSGDSVLNPKDTSMSVEMQIYVPQIYTSGTQVVFQKISGSTQGFCYYLLPTSSITSVDSRFSVFSSSYNMNVTAQLTKGAFNHVCLVWDRDNQPNSLLFYLNGELVSSSSTSSQLQNLYIDNVDLVLGSGSSFTTDLVVTPLQTLSATLDEFRLWHSYRHLTQIKQYRRRSVYADDDLKLYLRFNEPRPLLTSNLSDAINSIVIDSSGNSLHSLITNFTGTLRQDASIDATSQLNLEREDTCPVLFPAHEEVVDLNSTLLTSASLYDDANPNLITKLIPQHYLLEGAVADGFENIDEQSAYSGEGIPGQGKISNVQLLLSVIYTWARFFDDIKLYVDSFSTLKSVGYDTNNTIPDNFLHFLMKNFGFKFPELFRDSTISQYVYGEDVDSDYSLDQYSTRYVHSQLIRRILTNIGDIIRSKGTLHSVKAFLRSVGVDPDNTLRIREHGGPTSRALTYAKNFKHEIGSMVKFATSSLVISPYLSSSRVEPGVPLIAGTFVKHSLFPPAGVSNNISDGLLTSGSWTIETTFKYTQEQVYAMTNTTQSLLRTCVTGSSTNGLGLTSNVLLVSGAQTPKICLWLRPGTSTNSPLLNMTLSLPTSSVFNNDKWSVCYGVQRADSLTANSSSYFLRIASQNNGEIQYYSSTSSFFNEFNSSTDFNAFRILSSTFNASGTFVAIGSNQTVPVGSNYLYLNSSSISSEARVTTFDGHMSNLRFYSKALTEDEWKAHVLDFRSTGVTDPLKNWNYGKAESGSYERLRINSLNKQQTLRANATASLGTLGSILFVDHSQNGLHLTGSGFPIEEDCVKPEIFDVKFNSALFDESATDEKIRIRSFSDIRNISEHDWAVEAPVHEIVKSEEPTDSIDFSIELSLIETLNRDIMTVFSELDELSNMIGDPALSSSPDYPDLENLRNIYFNRIGEKLNFKAFFEFYKWITMSVSSFIDQLLPHKTNYRGINSVIESHVLERHKITYTNESLVSENARGRLDAMLLTTIDGAVNK